MMSLLHHSVAKWCRDFATCEKVILQEAFAIWSANMFSSCCNLCWARSIRLVLALFRFCNADQPQFVVPLFGISSCCWAVFDMLWMQLALVVTCMILKNWKANSNLRLLSCSMLDSHKMTYLRQAGVIILGSGLFVHSIKCWSIFSSCLLGCTLARLT